MSEGFSDQAPRKKPSWQTTYFGVHYLALYANRMIQPKETAWEASFVPLALELKAGSSILDVPCGFGRHIHRMVQAGFRVFGVDSQMTYLDYARRSTVDPRRRLVPLAAADMAHLPFASGSFDAAANLFNSFGYFGDDPADGPTNRDVMAEFARVLRPGGRLLIDVASRQPLVELIEEDPETRYLGGDWEIHEWWRYDKATRRIHNKTRFVVEDVPCDCGYDMRLYTREEIEDEMRAVGLEPWKFYSELHRDADETSGDRLVVAARKPETGG